MAVGPAQVISEVIELLEGASDMPYIGEDVSQLEHALQCADLAASAGARDELVAACLLHDIGHVCASTGVGPLGAEEHERIGAAYLRALGLAGDTARLVEDHVRAKRYLVTRSRAYEGKLSAASVATLRLQGGPMPEQEAAAFEGEALFREALRLRAWDEQAKVSGKVVPGLNAYSDVLKRVLARLARRSTRAC